jgi:hypothetical protein
MFYCTVLNVLSVGPDASSVARKFFMEALE